LDIRNTIKKPKFFLAENVSGMLAPRHKDALENIKSLFTESNYNLSFLCGKYRILDIRDTIL
jgi:site-specific DNA-cytosine methylase